MNKIKKEKGREIEMKKESIPPSRWSTSSNENVNSLNKTNKF